MGLITGLLTWPLAPVRGISWIGERVQEEALRQWSDPERVEEALRDVDARRRAGELTEEEVADLEEELVERLLQRPEGLDG